MYAGMPPAAEVNETKSKLKTIKIDHIYAGQAAEAEGFEPPTGHPVSAFKADAFGRSATLPWRQA
jgi:hypothetical protein